jgi:hypothetical protein
MASRPRPSPLTAKAGALCGLLMVLAVSAAGCATNPQFFNDDRVTIVEPSSLEDVTLPFRIRWESEIPEGQRYAVFIQTDTIGAGQTFDDFVAREGDLQCQASPSCPDEDYLARNHIYVTAGNEVEVGRFPPLPRGVRVMRAQIILVDEEGQRQSESVWRVRFRPVIEP